MGNWRERPRRNFRNQKPPWSASRNYDQDPPLEYWRDGIPLWEKTFCKEIGCVPWGKIVDSKNFIYCHTNVVNWDDSACEAAFHNAKRRYWAAINGHQCDIKLGCMHGLEIGGETNLAAGIQVAQLALKHRQNKKQQQRIIVFAGSPAKQEKKLLEMIGKKLKKNNVALDIIDFGEEDDCKPEKLEALLSAVNSNDSSHIVHVPSGPNALSDVLISTPIFTSDGEGGSEFAAASAGGAGFDFGVDPNLDPELALALRVSMEEERARQEVAAKRSAEETSKQEKGGELPSGAQDTTMNERASAECSDAQKTSDPMEDENALLQQALAMSMEDPVSSHEMQDTEMSDATIDDPELALALKLSVQEDAKDSTSQPDMSKLLADQSFVSSILASLPGVDPNDPSVKDLLASMQSQSKAEDKKNEEKPPKEDEEK